MYVYLGTKPQKLANSIWGHPSKENCLNDVFLLKCKRFFPIQGRVKQSMY